MNNEVNNEDKCPVCGNFGHVARGCKAPFGKRWLGKPAAKFLLRTPEGDTIEIVCALSLKMYKRAYAWQLAMIKHRSK